MVSCATPRNPDGTIDACKLTKPPKEAYIANAGHSFRSFSYPNPYEIPSNYTGCAKGWLGDYTANPKSFLVVSMRFDGGFLTSADAYDPDGLVASCEYDKNEMIVKSYIADRTADSCEDLLSSARRVVKRDK
jgi:hypothetical protein